MNVDSKVSSEDMEEVCVDAIMDSGACDTITSMEVIGGNEVRQTKASKKKEATVERRTGAKRNKRKAERKREEIRSRENTKPKTERKLEGKPK